MSNAIGTRRPIPKKSGLDHDRKTCPIQLTTFPLDFDFQATTPCASEVVEAMAPFWMEQWGNPSSRQHRRGLSASAAVNLARRQLADTLAVPPERVVFTSGATEANNLALLGHARFWLHGSGGPCHLISVSTEHHAVLDPLTQLRKEGCRVSLLKPDHNGLITANQLNEAIEPDTRLVSVMAANNEIGVQQPLMELAEVCHSHAITFHSDAAQAFGHIPLSPDALGLDLVSLSAHKIYGPKGIGALVVRDGVELEPLQWGGGQQDGLRAGTLPTALIVGFAMAARMALDDMESRSCRVRQLRDRLWAGLQRRIPGVQLNGAIEPRLPHNLNITIPDVRGVRLQRSLRAGIACSSGSACSNGAPSHVLQAIGRTRAQAEASLRLSLGRSTTVDEVDQAIVTIAEAAEAVKSSGSSTPRSS